VPRLWHSLNYRPITNYGSAFSFSLNELAAENYRELSYLRRPMVYEAGILARILGSIDVANGATFVVRSQSGIPRCHEKLDLPPTSSQP